MPIHQIINNGNTSYEKIKYPLKWELLFNNYLKYGDITNNNSGEILCFNENKKINNRVIPYGQKVNYNYESYATKKTFREVGKYPSSIIYSQFSEGIGGIYQFKQFLLKSKNAWFYIPSKKINGDCQWCYWDDKKQIYKWHKGNNNIPKGVYKFALLDRLVDKEKQIRINSKIIYNYYGNDTFGKVEKINRDSNKDIISYTANIIINNIEKKIIPSYSKKDYKIGEMININNNISAKITNIIKDNTQNINFEIEFETQKSLRIDIPAHEIRLPISGNSKIENKNIINDFNNSIINLCLIHYSITEGISFKCVRQIHILEPIKSPSQWEQVIARAARNGSHNKLKIPEDRYIQIIMWICVIPTNFGLISDTQFGLSNLNEVKHTLKNITPLITQTSLLGVTSLLQFVQGIFGLFLNYNNKKIREMINSLSSFSIEKYENMQQSNDYKKAIREIAKIWHQAMPQTPFQVTSEINLTNSPDLDILIECNKQMQAVNGLQELLKDLYQNSASFFPNKSNVKTRWNSNLNTEEYNYNGVWKPYYENELVKKIRLENKKIYKCMYEGKHITFSNTDKF